MKDFRQWLTEKQRRTGQGIYPPQYSIGQYAPLDNATKSASHLSAYANIHGGWPGQKELLSDPVKKEFMKKDKAGKTPKLLTKNPWEKSFSNTQK